MSTADQTASPIDLKPTFIAAAAAEIEAARNIQNAFLAYQTALEDQKAFREVFRIAERRDTHAAVTQLEEVKDDLKIAIQKATGIADQQVPEDLRSDLESARAVIARHRANVYHAHVFYKINWALAINKTGIIPLKRLQNPGVDEFIATGLIDRRSKRIRAMAPVRYGK